MRIGLDFWGVCSEHPGYFAAMAWACMREHDEVHIVSAIGPSRAGMIRGEVDELRIPYTAVHEVVFRHPRESPGLKLAKCQDLSLDAFYDDRDDVCRLLTEHGILAFRVTRKQAGSDVAAERDGG